MCSFESVCRSWGFTPTAILFVTFFRLVRAIQCFYYFASRGGLSIFTGYKDFIKGWVEGFVVVELKKDSASEVKMDQIKPPKNFTFSWESMNAALDDLLARRFVGEATQRVVEVISSKSASRPPVPTPSRAPKPSSRSSKSSRPSSRSRSSSAPQSSQAPRSRRNSNEGMEEALGVISRPVEGTELVRTDPVLPSEEVPEVRLETSAAEERASEKGMEVIPAGKGSQEAPLGVIPTSEGMGPGPIDGGDVAVKVGGKRPAPAEVPAPVSVPKKSRAFRRPAPALPPLEKKKEAPVVPLLSAPDNDILNAEDITHQTPASVVAEILREQMFSGITEASDPRLLTLTGLLAGFTREQAAFQSRPRGELGDRIREMLLMREEALAQVVVLEQELSKQADSIKGLTLAAEESKLQNQQLCQQVNALEKRCSALLEDAKLAEDRVQLECEERLREYKESAELKKEIEQACKAHLQSYKDSSELKAKIAEACKERLAEFKASSEMKTAIWNKGFSMFVSGYNRGLRTAIYAPSTSLAELRAAEEDYDGEEVLYREDDRPLPKGASRTTAGPSEANTELGKGDEGARPQG
ncbi:uncharacterized protein LOC122722225 [Manihot esculenta]|uniref:uncharacterized protein LOC122722225 n=1 Tax=Manihot esculenta TaxID=3983 RepID=UPI001CC56BFC|nr:uncharacterized protein LOC122722225 [Manihot esculenta]